MRIVLILSGFLFAVISCKSQNTERIYSFMNNELPAHEFGKSSWGIFFLAAPVMPDSAHYNRLLKAGLKNIPENIQSQLYKNYMALSNQLQDTFRWAQSEMKHTIIVDDTKHKILQSKISNLMWSTQEIRKATYWIKEWNQTKAGDRLINYSSIPVFSDDGQYVLILRGQDAESEGGWDTLYIYKKEAGKWIIAERLIISEI